MTPLISIIHPSRGRVEMATNTAAKWIENAVYKDRIEYWFACDSDDPQREAYHNRISELNLRATYSVNGTAINAINRVAPNTKGNLIVVVSDDFDCPPQWDYFLLKKLEDKTDYLVKTSDGYMNNKWLITLPIMDRAYYNRFGYVYYPEYQHMFSDTEMTCVGNMLGKVIDLQDPNFIFEHKHYSANKMVKDAINEKNDATWHQGKALFLSRHANDFGLNESDVVMRYPQNMFA